MAFFLNYPWFVDDFPAKGGRHLSHQANFHCLQQGWKATKGKMHQTTQQWIPETPWRKKTSSSFKLEFFVQLTFEEDLLRSSKLGGFGMDRFFSYLLSTDLKEFYTPAIERGSSLLAGFSQVPFETIFGSTKLESFRSEPRNAKDRHRHPCKAISWWMDPKASRFHNTLRRNVAFLQRSFSPMGFGLPK